MTTSEAMSMGNPLGGTRVHGVRRRLAMIVWSIGSSSSSGAAAPPRSSSGISGWAYSADTYDRAERGAPASGAPTTAEVAPEGAGNDQSGPRRAESGAHGSGTSPAPPTRRRAGGER